MPPHALAVELNRVRAGVFLRVDIARGKSEMQKRSLWHVHTLEDFVLGGQARRKPLGGRSHAHCLLDKGAHSRRICAEFLVEVWVFTHELGLLGEGVLGGLQATEHHGVHDADDLDIAQLSPECLVGHLRQEADHVVLGAPALFGHLVFDVVSKGFECIRLAGHLLPREFVARALSVDEGHDLESSPFGELGDVFEGKAQDGGQHDLGERAGELRDEFDLSALDPTIEKFVGGAGDHGGVSSRTGAHPGVGEFLAMRAVEFLGGAQRGHRDDHGVHRGGELGLGAGQVGFFDCRSDGVDGDGQERSETLGILDHARDIRVLAEDKRVAPRGEAFSGKPVDGRLGMENFVGLVPMLLAARAEKVDIVERDGALHRAERVIGRL